MHLLHRWFVRNRWRQILTRKVSEGIASLQSRYRLLNTNKTNGCGKGAFQRRQTRGCRPRFFWVLVCPLQAERQSRRPHNVAARGTSLIKWRGGRRRHRDVCLIRSRVRTTCGAVQNWGYEFRRSDPGHLFAPGEKDNFQKFVD